jgi:light-regulated signal transduction histidine kinase (bacteriophytochrome)
MPQIVWTARADGSVDYYNERWYEFTGFDRGKVDGWEQTMHPDDIKRCDDAWRDSIRNGEPFNLEYRIWDRRENRFRWFIGRALPVLGEDGFILKWFGTGTDIDDQKRVEDKLRRANQDLEQFAYSASHDLQEPLRTIKIYGELLTKRYAEKLDGQAFEFLEYLRTGATRMEVLVGDLLAYTQVTLLDLPPESTDANEALAATLASLAGAINESGAEITSDPLPSLRIPGIHLQQLLQNLIGNAIKYRNPNRTPVVHVSGKQEKGSWIFSVRDNGIGIDAEYKEHIFGLFKRLHTGDEYSGTGIGLAICQRIVERYHGRIWVESEPQNGSTFFFTLPI